MNDVGSSPKMPKPESTPPAYLGTPDDATVISSRESAGTGVGRAGPMELGRLLAGETLDHFELVEYVGGGGMGAVFRARDTLLNREVAVKVLARDQGSDIETKRRFRNEAQSAARLDHENIARVYFVGEDRGLNYIVFEFIEGVNLRERVVERGGPLPLDEAISYTVQIARALEHASRRDVVHRDIKPSNVLITAEGKAKLVDMGLARLHQVDASGMDLTASGVTLGTFDYISPEQARDPRSADVRSDLYSLGCTLFFMLTARPPFPEGTVLQKLLQHNSDAPPDPAELNPTLPPEVSTIVGKLLAKNPRHRYQTPSDLVDDLLVVGERLGLSLGQGTVTIATPRPRTWIERHMPWMVPVAVLIGIVAVLELASRDQGTSDEPPPIEAVTSVEPVETPPAEPPSTVTATTSIEITPPETPTEPATVTDSATVATSEPPVVPMPEAPRDGLLVVSPTADGPRQYSSLRAACAEAKNGDVIELRYNGPREERPIALHNTRLTIRAADGFHPVIVFRPDDSDPLAYPRSMISVAGGRLTMFNLTLELRVPSQWDVPADSWTFLEAEHCEALEVNASVLTIRNHGATPGATHPNVAFFQIRSPLGFDMMMDDAAIARDPVAIQLQNTVARGEATLLRINDRGPIDLTWNNGLFVGSNYLVTATGSEDPPRPDDRLRLTLRHLTAVVGAGLIEQVTDYAAPYALPIDVQCDDSVLMSTADGSLIVQQGSQSVDALQRQLAWHGERNFYEGFAADRFWRIIDTSDFDQPRDISYDSWLTEQVEILPAWDKVQWKRLPPADRPLDQHTPRDYALDDQSADNASLGSASDGRDVGMSLVDLPLSPSPQSGDDRRATRN